MFLFEKFIYKDRSYEDKNCRGQEVYLLMLAVLLFIIAKNIP